MEALGQAFSLARELQSKAGKVQSGLRAGYLDVVPDRARGAMAPPPGAEALYADLESIMKQGGLDNPSYGMHHAPPGGGSYLDVKPNASRATYLDVKPNAGVGAGGLDNPTYGMTGAQGGGRCVTFFLFFSSLL